MPQIPGRFNDGDILFAAPMELIRDFLENSLAFRATAAGQILVSTGAGDMAGDNTELLQVPQTGMGVLSFVNGVASLEDFTFESGVLESDTGDFPEEKMPVHDWTLESSNAEIPVSFLPNLNIEPVLIGTYSKPNQSTVAADRWAATGITVPSDLSRLLIVRLSDKGGSVIGSRFSYSQLVFTSDLENSTVVVADTSVDRGNDYLGITAMLGGHNNTASIFRFLLTLDVNRQLLLGPGNALEFGSDFSISLYEVSDRDAGQYAPIATPQEASDGVVVDVRQWSPQLIRTATTANATDLAARAAADDAQADADANAVDIAANTAAIVDKLNTADLADNIEGFAVVGDAATVPTARLAPDSVTEGKLSPQVRAKLAVSASQQGENIEWASMTQVEYDALASYDLDRLYIIVG